MEMVATRERLLDLQRTVDTLHGRLQDMQWELRHAKGLSLTERLLKNLLGSRQGNAFMSACCNRRVRPNTKVMNHVGTTTGH
jgi:hypothetical protein